MPQIIPVVDMTQVFQFATNLWNSVSNVVYLIVGTAFAFMVLGGLVSLFWRRKQGYD